MQSNGNSDALKTLIKFLSADKTPDDIHFEQAEQAASRYLSDHFSEVLSLMNRLEEAAAQEKSDKEITWGVRGQSKTNASVWPI